MRDGVSALHFENASDRKPSQHPHGDSRDYNAHAWGELLLGHEKNDHSNPWAVPGAYATPGALRDLTTVPERVRYGQFFQDASFGAFRKMAQNTQAFDDYLSRQAARVQGTATGDEMTAYVKSWVKAKMLGRWENGEVVRPEHGLPAQRGYLTDAERARMSLTAPAANATDPTASKDNNDLNAFSFADDKAALGCPFGAHIRRMNPRQDPVVPFLRRPLVRRGLPYGGPDDAEKGLLGLFLCSSLEEQFEHLLGNWADNNPMGTPLQWAGKDPVIGNHERYGGRFEVPMADAGALAFDTMPVFVETRGTAYLLFPALHALRQMAEAATGAQE
jgi:hypothetical protein